MPTLFRPPADRLAALLADAAAAEPTHEPGGLDGPGDRWTDAGPLRTGVRGDLGRGPAVFAAARAAVRRWGQFPCGAEVCDAASLAAGAGPPAPPAVGANVCVLARGGGLWWTNPARICDVTDEPDCFSVAYVTLPGHVCRGEERFRLTRDPNGRVWYDVRADSVLADPLARLVGPLVRRRQKDFARDSVAAMRRAVAPADDLVPRSAPPPSSPPPSSPPVPGRPPALTAAG